MSLVDLRIYRELSLCSDIMYARRGMISDGRRHATDVTRPWEYACDRYKIGGRRMARILLWTTSRPLPGEY